jgi:hypothetical protein
MTMASRADSDTITKPSLLALPPELRIQIYSYVFDDIDANSSLRTGTSEKNLNILNTAFTNSLRTARKTPHACSLIRREAKRALEKHLSKLSYMPSDSLLSAAQEAITLCEEMKKLVRGGATMSAAEFARYPALNISTYRMHGTATHLQQEMVLLDRLLQRLRG